MYKVLLIFSLIALVFSACSRLDPTPKRVQTTFDQKDPEYVVLAFDNLLHRGLYESANTLMCQPDEENLLFKKAEQLYKDTIGTPESSVIRMNMYRDDTYSYYKDAYNNIEEQIFSIRQHYYFGYSKEYTAFIIDDRNIMKQDRQSIKISEKIFKIQHLNKDMKKKPIHYYLLKHQSHYCINKFYILE